MIPVSQVRFVCALWLLPLFVAAQDLSLSLSSPFMPPAGAAGAAPSEPNAIEFRGLFKQGDAFLFNLVDVSTRKGTWVKLDEAGPQGWCVKKYDRLGENDTITVEAGGRTLTLSLAKPRIAKSAAAVPGQAAASQRNLGPVTPVVLNPTREQQARAQEDIIAEVRRRRLQRQQNAAGQRAPQP